MEPEVEFKGDKQRRRKLNPAIKLQIQDKKKTISHLRTNVKEEEEEDKGLCFYKLRLYQTKMCFRKKNLPGWTNKWKKVRGAADEGGAYPQRQH